MKKRYAEFQHNNPSKRSKIEEVDPEEFRSSYQDLINQHKHLVPLKKELLRYQEILNEELQRQESDPNHILDQQKIEQAA